MSSRTLASGFWDNDNLDAWEIPFGLWIEEIVFWLTTHIKGFLDAVKWPVDKLLELIIDNVLQDWLPWPVVLLLFFLLGAATRNFLVGLGSAAGLLICGLLGNEYWDLTMETIGMIIVAVLICTAIGIPLGILAARVDAFWSRLRPVLDGMQVIHPFVYLLPIIFLFGVRRTPGVLATLVFALPPIVRLTNLGIRQVPADVVEAARAFGATEIRILREVQMPLARPAIMAGLNQTLLLSLSMVGIVAIIAGGGLGQADPHRTEHRRHPHRRLSRRGPLLRRSAPRPDLAARGQRRPARPVGADTRRLGHTGRPGGPRRARHAGRHGDPRCDRCAGCARAGRPAPHWGCGRLSSAVCSLRCRCC